MSCDPSAVARDKELNILNGIFDVYVQERGGENKGEEPTGREGGTDEGFIVTLKYGTTMIARWVKMI